MDNSVGYKQTTKWEDKHTKIVEEYKQRVKEGSVKKIRIINKD